MKNLLGSAALLTLFGSILLTGGCQNPSYDELWSMNRKVNQELSAAKDKIRLLEAERQKLEADLADRDRALAAAQEKINNLLSENSLLQAAIDKLKAELANRGDIKPPVLAALPKGLTDALINLAKQYPGLFDVDEKNGLVRFKEDLTFDKGSDDVNARAAEALKKFADIMDEPAWRSYYLYVAGHTDDMPIKKPDTLAKHKTNWGLSAHRAIAVAKVLADGGVDQPRLAALGFSKYHPIETNAPGEKGNAANRRVEIWILTADRILTPDASAVAKEAPAAKAGKKAEEAAPAEEK